jgi:MOSC domain-containing protein YiiM
MTAGTLVGIFVKRAHTGPMDAVSSAMLDDKGLVGNANRGGFRAVTVVSRERWDELMTEVGAALGPDARRANLVVSGLDLEKSRGKTLRIGSCVLLIGGETRPCEVMEEAAPGLQAAMEKRWGGGAYATVVTPGPIALHDAVTFL